MRAPRTYPLPEEVQPVSSAEYERQEEETYDFEFQNRNRHVLNLADRAYPDQYGYVRRVTGTRIGGRRWDFLEKWDS